jgi:TolB protein
MGRFRPFGLALLLALVLAACGSPPWQRRAAGPAPQPNRLAIVDEQGDVFTIGPDGADRRQLTTLGAAEEIPNRSMHFWPTWSPDARWIAAARGEFVDGEATSLALYALPAAGGEARRLFGGEDTLPFFYSWAPDARSLAVLSQTEEGLALDFAPFEGAPRRATTARGSLYLAWSADGKQLATHVDGAGDRNAKAAISLHRTDGTSADLSLRPSSFRAPAFARDGKTLYVGALDGTDRNVVIAAPVDGSHGRQVALTYLPAQFGAAAPWHDQPVIAFFWSPDGTKLAWIGLDAMARELALYVADAPGAKRKLLAFTPSQSFLQTLAYFDQYATTTAVWSPDSRSLQVAGWLDREHIGPSQIWVVSADGTTSPLPVADGTLASWSPLAK